MLIPRECCGRPSFIGVYLSTLRSLGFVLGIFLLSVKKVLDFGIGYDMLQG